MNTIHTDVPVDHVIFFAGYGLAELASFFESVGFNLTPLGRHNSGSANRLAMLGDSKYIELMGFEPGTPKTVRPELQSLPLGLNGIVATDVAGRTRRCGSEGLNPSVHLERRVDTAHARGTASFTITTVREPIPDARTFMCRHHTPQLVWQEAWQSHANSAQVYVALQIATQHPQRLHRGLRTIFDIVGDAQADAYDLAGTLVQVVPAGERSSLTVRTSDLTRATGVLRASGIAHTAEEARVVVPLPEPYTADLIFTAAP
jgi:hypothetical protein